MEQRVREMVRPNPVPPKWREVPSRPLEGVENRLLALGKDPDAGIGDVDAERRAGLGIGDERDDDAAALGELQGVPHQVDQDPSTFERSRM